MELEVGGTKRLSGADGDGGVPDISKSETEQS